jgi:hypothetical protein
MTNKQRTIRSRTFGLRIGRVSRRSLQDVERNPETVSTLRTGARMKRSTLFLTVVMLVCVTLHSSGQTKKYDIKSCTITFESTQKMAGFDMKNKVVLYFDEYGMKECRETYEGDKLRDVYLSDGKNLYSINPAKKTAVKRGEASNGTEVRVAWNDVSDDDKKSGKAKQLPTMTLGGKPCEAFVVGLEGSTTTYASWNHVLMLIDMKSKDMTMLKKAVSVDEKAPVSADKFKIPAGYTIK